MLEVADSRILELTTQIISAHVANNSVPADVLPGLIRDVHKSLQNAESPPVITETDARSPAVNPRKSVFQDYIICLEDGKKLKMLRRHLKSAYNLTPEQYRARWGLPSEYPMVAPAYAAVRSDLARKIGLGRKEAPHTALPIAVSKPKRRHDKV